MTVTKQRIDESRTLLKLAYEEIMQRLSDDMKLKVIYNGTITANYFTNIGWIKKLVEKIKQVKDLDKQILETEKCFIACLVTLRNLMLQESLIIIDDDAWLQQSFMFAFGAYVEQESKKEDQWRDKGFYDHWIHLHHEAGEKGELIRSKTVTIQMHNLTDAVMLSLILYCYLRNELIKNKNKKRD